MFVPHRAENNGQLRKRNGHKIHKQRLCPRIHMWTDLLEYNHRLASSKTDRRKGTLSGICRRCSPRFSSESSSTIENAANEAMKIVTKWGSENKLNFAPQKHKLWC
ncbi:hypothetical protein EVAR_85960_1 [Eumeta japonica]|uniref:Uncharacterized protein n=1 Tax=Eumeta variegata TaxID=151549 RepID=A0A4C1UJ60_EUMVA|nr:hypothetical protein EVAR_85960_1 [Eumeta japonica]